MIKSAITGSWRFAVYVLIALVYFILCYLTPRENFVQLISLYALLFLFYLAVLKYFTGDQLVKEGIYLSVLLRFLIVFSMPNLSDDFYRFIWDGNLIKNGINPFEYTPTAIHQLQGGDYQISGLSFSLYNHLNSKEYFSVYPPVCQGIFGFSAWLSAGNLFINVVLLKVFIFLFELGTLVFLGKILRILNKEPRKILIYALNPLIIIELCGNIHFEAGMLFFITLSFYLLLTGKNMFSAAVFGLAISTKLLPLLFLPLLFKYKGFPRTIMFSLITGIVTIACFLPFLSPVLISNVSHSIYLYFNEFEYNASIYNLLKWFISWDNIYVKDFLQQTLPVATFLAIIVLAMLYKKKNFFTACLMAAVIYYFLSTTIHPWYISVLVLLTPFTSYRFVIAWTGLIYLSYITYRITPYHENFCLVALEYLLVYGLLAYEITARIKMRKIISR